RGWRSRPRSTAPATTSTAPFSAPRALAAGTGRSTTPTRCGRRRPARRPMQIPLYQIDAFADGPFTGNPAAVCPLEAWLPDAVMQSIAAENNLSETAFFVPEGDGYRLRWFTPAVEVDLCGHATLASAYVIFRWLQPGARTVVFQTQQAGPLAVARDGELLALDF